MPLVGMLAPAVISRGGIHSFTVIPAVLELAPAVIGRGGYPSEGKAAWILAFALARRSFAGMRSLPKTFIFFAPQFMNWSIICCRAERR